MPWWPLLAGMLALTIPTIVSLGGQTWSTEAGAHGPIVIATGLWLLYHEGLTFARARDAMPWSRVLPLFIPALLIYIFGRAYDFISLEVFALYLVFIAMLLRLFGFDEIKKLVFPLLYLAFVIPVPGWVLDRVTAPLQLLVSYWAEHLTALLGYPVARQGVTLVVAQYELLVEDACAGMNSLIGLLAVSLFYIYMVRRASWAYTLTLLALIVPFAILVNVLRVVALILITYHFGNEAAQGFLHGTTGMVLFGLALLLIFGADVLLSRFLGKGEAR
ncbi:exosortase V [Novosphingobium sp. G106]|uniref:exosortase V n=1 Tax=Novosphingobium sp. G106 TaxID=2849500 RepID=UPI001C2D23BA|nr:exosortase V [Novosphingobium sp. G106]MBV1689587.1 exosortase V [Novosphingobium sp. G106]